MALSHVWTAIVPPMVLLEQPMQERPQPLGIFVDKMVQHGSAPGRLKRFDIYVVVDFGNHVFFVFFFLRMEKKESDVLPKKSTSPSTGKTSLFIRSQMQPQSRHWERSASHGHRWPSCCRPQNCGRGCLTPHWNFFWWILYKQELFKLLVPLWFRICSTSESLRWTMCCCWNHFWSVIWVPSSHTCHAERGKAREDASLSLRKRLQMLALSDLNQTVWTTLRL